MHTLTIATCAALTYTFAATYILACVWAWALSARDDARLAEGMRVAAADRTCVRKSSEYAGYGARAFRYYTWARTANRPRQAARFTGLRTAPDQARTAPGVAPYAPCDLIPTAVGA